MNNPNILSHPFLRELLVPFGTRHVISVTLLCSHSLVSQQDIPLDFVGLLAPCLFRSRAYLAYLFRDVQFTLTRKRAQLGLCYANRHSTSSKGNPAPGTYRTPTRVVTSRPKIFMSKSTKITTVQWSYLGGAFDCSGKVVKDLFKVWWTAHGVHCMESYLFKKISEICLENSRVLCSNKKRLLLLLERVFCWRSVCKLEFWPNQLISLTCWAADASEILDALNLLPS